MTFIKTNCSVMTEKWITKEDEKVLVPKMIKEKGHMYKGLLHLIKEGPGSWTLSHELTGNSIITLQFTTFTRAKKATVLIYSLIDWNTKDKEILQDKLREENISNMVREIINADENTLEILRLQLLEKPKSSADMIALMTA